MADVPLAKKRKTHVISGSPTIETTPPKAEAKSEKSRKQPLPKFRLKTPGLSASLSVEDEDRVPLVLTDIQHLLLHSLFGNLNLTEPPRWYVIDKCNKICQTTCLIIEGVSLQHYLKNIEKFSKLNKIFPDLVEIITPSLYNGSFVRELALVPLSEAEKDFIIQKYGSMNLAMEARKDLMVMMRAVFPIGDCTSTEDEITYEDNFPRTQLILSAWQLIDEGYPLPLKGKLQNAYSDYVMTKDKYEPVTANSPMYGVDCEMCMTNVGSELTRVSIVDEKHETIYEALVKPYNAITDYLTRYSGITRSLLYGVKKRLEDVQDDIRNLLPPDAILVGQSLNSDLHALKMMHPYIIDTSIIFNISGQRSRKTKLKVLAKEFLNQDIQTGGRNGHCSVEDSLASLKLVQLKLSKNMEFGDAVHTNRQKYKENLVNKITTKHEYGLSIFNHMIDQKITSMVIGCDNITGDYHTYLSQAKESLSVFKKNKTKKIKLSTVDTNEDIITNLIDATNSQNFVMAHMKLDVEEKDELIQMETIDGWIETVWKALKPGALFVVIFGGTNSDNGVGMMTVKSN